ncbi:Hypothetical protein D9617_27g045070 [Elsinoe fawcettii]|nr:Hypothetical protein D9617_27g045070 [Elsinoe fawcettii]
MSRPQYNFADERPSSPFDRRPQGNPSEPPPNFKTNVNRNKTRKWTEAKQYNYDGDEWGGFDPYDEYGNYDDPAGPPQIPRARQHSFDRGEERRAFSAGTGPPGQYQRGPPPQQRRDFSQPAYAPAPLKSTQSPTGRGGPAAVPLRDEEEDDKKDGKPPAAIPFIRPSDIYKRMEQERERERQSLDSSRPSIDSASSKRTGTEPAASLSAVPEKKAEPSVPIEQPQKTDPPASTDTAPTLPDDMPRSSIDGFQSIVDRAFDRPDDNSVPPTPISTSNSQKTQEDLSRSNSESTTGISPIMSRVPSSNTDESRGRAAAMHRERAMSNITEEIPLEPPPKSANRQTTPTAATHSRPDSVESFIPGHTRKVSTPSPHASPARSPRMETTTNRRLSQPLAAEVTEDDVPEPASATSNYSQSTYPASATSDRPAPAFPPPAASIGEKSPTSETPVALKVGSRSSTPLTSPTEGRKSPFAGSSRVRDLAGRYNEIHEESRRNSQASIKSKTSYSSLRHKSSVGSGHASPEPPASADPVSSPGERLERPPYNPQPSFRPHLPGEWISTTDLRADPVAAPSSNLASTAEEKDLPKTPTAPSAPSEIDLTPKAATVDRSASTKTSGSGPVDALKAAGAALGASLTSSVGTSHQARDFASPPPKEETTAPKDDQPKRSIGDVYMRPLEFQRTASSIASSDAPTPPAKDTPSIDESAVSDPYFHRRPNRDSRDSWEGSVGDEDEEDSKESDRLRREIVRSLTPQAQERATYEHTRDQDAIDAPDNLKDVQKAEGIQPTQSSPLRTAQSISDLPEVAELDGSGPRMDAGPGLLNKRFSWESKPASSVNPSNLASEVNLPQTGLHVTNQEEPLLNETPVAASDDVNRDRHLSASSVTPVPEGRSPVSPVANAEDGRPSTSENPPSPLLTGQADRLSSDANATAQQEPIVAASGPGTSDPPAKIPSFREIANIKSAPERIDKYNVTRKQFAEMNTGLQGWLSTTIAANPDLSYLTKPDANIVAGAPPPGAARHRQTPSIIKMAKGLGSKGDSPASPSGPEGQTGPQPSRRTSNNFSGHSPQSSVNAEKMQAMGKDFLSSAGKLGGKGITGAKGWLAKGKQRLRDGSGGGDKAPSTDNSRSVTPASSAAPTLDNTRNSSPGLSDAPATSTLRPRLSKRNSSSWSANRLSMTFGLRNGSSEKSRSRSRPQSLILPSRSSTPMLDLEKLGLDEKIVEESPHPDRTPSQPSTAAAASWTASWDQHDVSPPIVSPFNEPGFRLGVLPSPGVETFSSSARGSHDNLTMSGSPIRGGRFGSDAGLRSRRDTVDSHILSPIAQRSPEDDTFRGNTLPERLTRSVSPLVQQKDEQPRDLDAPAIAELGPSSPVAARKASEEPGESATVLHPCNLAGNTTSNAPSVIQPAIAELGTKSPVELRTAYQWEPQQTPQQAIESQSKSPIELPVTDEVVDLYQRDLTPLEQPQSGAQSPLVIEDKKDTPMIASPEFRLNDQNSKFGSEDERSEWEGVKSQISKSQLSNNSSKRSSGMALSTGLHSVPSDVSLISAGTVERPAQVELVRVGSPKLVNNRSSLPSQSRKSSYATSTRAAAHKEIEHLRIESRNTDSPTVPEHLTPRSTTFPPEMYDSDSTPFTTPGEEDRRIDETMMPTPTAPRAPAMDLPDVGRVQNQSLPSLGVERMPLVLPAQKRFGVVAEDPEDIEVPTAGTTGPSAYDAMRSGKLNRPLPSQTDSFPPSREFTPPPQASEPYGYRRTPPRRISGADGQRWSQYQTQLDRDTQFGADYYGPPQYQQQPIQPVADNSDSYHRDYMDDRLVEMSPLEATMFNREDAFRQATERQQQEGASSRKHSRTSSLGPSLVSEPPKSSHQAEHMPPNAFKRSSSRLLNRFDRPPSATSSTLASNRMSNMTSTMDLDSLDNPSKGKLIKKDRRSSIQRPTSTATPSPLPEKKKRFSGLGSLFGRSKSSAVESSSSISNSKRNRLSKQGPMIISAPRQISPDKLAPQEDYTVTPSNEQATLADDNYHPRSLTPLSRRSSGMMHSSPSRSNTMNTLGSRNGYLSPGDEQSYAQPTLPNVQPSTRRLHSERNSKRFSYVDVPEEFQPVDSSYRSGMSPIEPPRLSQVFEQTIPPPGNRGHASGRFPSNGSRVPSGSGQYSQPDFYRRTSSQLSGYSSTSPPPQRLNSLPQVMANQPPPGLRDNGGYYIPDNGRPQQYQPSHMDYHPSYNARPGDEYYNPHPSMQYGGQRSGYYSPDTQDSGSMHSGYGSRRSSNPPPHQPHRRTSSREASVPYSFMTVSNHGPSSIPPTPNQGQSPDISPERSGRRLSSHNTGSGIRHESPSKRQAEEHNEFVRQSYERQQGLRTMPSNSSRDSELYLRPQGRAAPPQPGRLMTDFSGSDALPQQGGGGGHKRNESEEAPQMKGASYPGNGRRWGSRRGGIRGSSSTIGIER